MAHAQTILQYDLFPRLEPYSSGFLPVDDVHTLYWEQSGNPQGVPILLLHGGPGAGATPAHRQYFDPDFYRIIIFDQRGCGRSSPLGCLTDNTTQHLIDDIEQLRNHLSIESWHLFGGSWGCTLSLAYAIQHPQRCISMILRGVFLCEEDERHWFLHGIKTLFPEAYEQFIAPLPAFTDDTLLETYYGLLTGDDFEKQIEAAISWSLYEGACSSLLPNYEIITTQEQKNAALALARLEAHYFTFECRSAENSLLNNIDTIRHIPTSIIQGRYDAICPIGHGAHRLHDSWPEADYIVVPNAGHSSMDPPLRSRLIEATENAKTLT
jgi:proline iminopeptidase